MKQVMLPLDEQELDNLLTCVENRLAREYQARNENGEFETELIEELEELSAKLKDFMPTTA